MGARVGVAESSASVEAVQEAVLRGISRGPEETVPLEDAAGRVLARPIIAAEDLWPFARAAMDGIAVLASDLAGAAQDTPVRLRLVGEVHAGQTWEVPLQPGDAVRVATGAPIPPGADAVVPREVLEWLDDDVLMRQPVSPGRHIFPPAEDARAGEVVLEAGAVLSGGHVALLAAVGCDRVPVVRRPVVVLLATGDELTPPSAAARPGQVRESNTYGLSAEVRRLGAEPRRLGIARDNTAELDEKIREGLGADVLIICGGASVGDRDLVRGALGRNGVRIVFAGVSMKPGSPAGFGLAGTRPVFSLPGTPGAARVAFEVLVRPALRAMLGYRHPHPPTVLARLAKPLAVTPGRRRYLWGHATMGVSGVLVTPLVGQGTATIRSISDANALIVLQPQDADLAAGSPVTVLLIAGDDLGTTVPSLRRVLGIVGAPGAGKTTLIERLIPELRQQGLAVAVVKHHAHLDMSESPTTDTARSAHAGAVETVLAGSGGMILRGELSLDQILLRLAEADVILVEGYSQSSLPKILVQRSGVASDRPAPAGPVVAVVGDVDGLAGKGVDCFGWDDVGALARMIALPRASSSPQSLWPDPPGRAG